MGSHLDTVRNAGKFDGPLGVILAIACIGRLHQMKMRLPFTVEVIGFADEEGVRYQTAYLGSKVSAGIFNEADLQRKDGNGISMSDAIRQFGGNPSDLKKSRLNPKKLLGYVEVHIEQGPVLEKNNQAVGIVSGIAGQTRLKLTFTGRAGHAGTTPMSLRKDALCAASEFILAVENLARKKSGLVATVGQIQTEPNASNVIPGAVAITVDVRHQKDSVRRSSVDQLRKCAREIEKKRAVKISWQLVQQTASVLCSRPLSALLKRAAQKHQREVIELASGAGHDAAVMAKITPAAMLFVRCKNGLSHHPDEFAKTNDVRVAFKTVSDFIQSLAHQYA
jgi:allantoate deiminase